MTSLVVVQQYTLWLRRLLLILPSFFSAFWLISPSFAFSSQPEITPISRIAQCEPQIPYQNAQLITTKVLTGETWGSGVIIRKRGGFYTVLTNEHVLLPGVNHSYRIQTHDGRIHFAKAVKVTGFAGKDLGILQFWSIKSYAVAVMEAAGNLAVGDEVFSAGFPLKLGSFVFTTGKISLLLDKALEGGYQIGYTNEVQKGMSGGPLLNQKGHVVGINGQHAYPLWGNGYLFQDGSRPDQSLQTQLIQLSWALPIQNVLQIQL